MADDASPLLHCQAHGALAGWECAGCHRPLCPDCAAQRVIPPVTLSVCTYCGEHAEPLLRRKAEASSLSQRALKALAFPFSIDGLAMWGAFTVWLTVTSYLGLFGQLLGWGAAVGSFFGLTRSVGRGSEHFELSDFRDPLESMGMPLIRLAVATLPWWGLVAMALGWHQGWLLWLAHLVGLLWVPTAYVGAAAGASLQDLLNPVRVLSATGRIGRDYVIYAAVSVGLLVALGVLSLVALMLNALPLPLVPTLLGRALMLFPVLVAAHVAGSVLLLHGEVFGWSDTLGKYEPVLGQTEPRATWQPKEPERSHAPIELEPEPEHVRSVPDRFQALEASPDAPSPEVRPLDAAALQSHAQQSARLIRRAVQQQDVEGALDGWRATGLSAASELSFDELLWLGQTAASRIDFESAELAFRLAVQREAAPESLARARVMYARLLSEKLQRTDEGVAMMQQVLREHPGSQAAAFAAQWLSAKE